MDVVSELSAGLGVSRPQAEAVLGCLLRDLGLAAEAHGRWHELLRAIPELIGWRARAAQLGLGTDGCAARLRRERPAVERCVPMVKAFARDRMHAELWSRLGGRLCWDLSQQPA